MGAVCCVAAKDQTITNILPSQTFQRRAPYSPSWSSRWDNRRRVAGEETSSSWLLDTGDANDQIVAKSRNTVEIARGSEEGSPLDNSFPSQKPPVYEGNAGILRLPSSDQANSRNLEVKELTKSPSVSYPSVPSISSMSPSPLSSHTFMLPSNSTPSRWHHHSPGHRLLRQVSDFQIPEYKSPALSISEERSAFLPLTWDNESKRGSNGGSSESGSTPAFSELMSTRRERWSFDSEFSSFSREKFTRSSGRNSRSPSLDLQSCGVCMKLLTERSSWGWNTQKIISTNELAVVSVLTCGHVYHAECLESVTPEINKYDPQCPVCTFGAKRAVKMSEEALIAELDLKARKRCRKRIVGSLNSNGVFGHHKLSGIEGKGSKLSSSSSMKSSPGKPFLRRHFSFGSNTENKSTQKLGLFWARSSKE